MIKSTLSAEEIKKALNVTTKSEEGLKTIIKEENYFRLPYYSAHGANGDLIVYSSTGILMIPFKNVRESGAEILTDASRMMSLEEVEVVEAAIEWMTREKEKMLQILNGNYQIKSDLTKQDFLSKEYNNDIELSKGIKENERLIVEYAYENYYGFYLVFLEDETLFIPIHEVEPENGWEKYNAKNIETFDKVKQELLKKAALSYEEKIKNCQMIIEKQKLRKLLEPEKQGL